MSLCKGCKYNTCLQCKNFYVPFSGNNDFGCKRKDKGKLCYCDNCIHRMKFTDNFKRKEV